MLAFTFPITHVAHRMALVKVAPLTKRIPFKVPAMNLC